MMLMMMTMMMTMMQEKEQAHGAGRASLVSDINDKCHTRQLRRRCSQEQLTLQCQTDE